MEGNDVRPPVSHVVMYKPWSENKYSKSAYISAFYSSPEK